MCFVVTFSDHVKKYSLSEYIIRIGEDALFVFDLYTGAYLHKVMLFDIVGISLEPLSVEEVL